MTELAITVIGTPAPQGSKSFKGMRHGKPILVESSSAVGPWRAAVVAAARLAISDYEAEHGVEWIPLDGPLRLDAIFMLAPPQTMPKGRTEPTTYPDLSKLVRSTEDALVTAGVLVDDSRFTQERTQKAYADPGGVTGARLKVSRVASQLVLI